MFSYIVYVYINQRLQLFTRFTLVHPSGCAFAWRQNARDKISVLLILLLYPAELSVHLCFKNYFTILKVFLKSISFCSSPLLLTFIIYFSIDLSWRSKKNSAKSVLLILNL